MKRLIPFVILASVAVAACGSSSKSSTGSSTTTPTTTGSSSASATGNPSSPVTVSEAGSSLLFPYLQELVSPLKAQYSNLTLNPAAGGSGAGINDAATGVTDLGGSDAYLSPSDFTEYPTLINIPVVVSSQAVDYNLPTVKNLKLNGNVLAEIYQGKITKWNDPAIAAINPGVTLPSTSIVPVRREDSSGDTFLFTSFLSATNSTWSNGPGYDTKITWPTVASEQTATGNPGMVTACKAVVGCIAYVGISAQSSAVTAGLQEAQLQNKSGTYLTDSSATVLAAVAAGASSVPSNLAASLIYESGANAYPIVNFEYIVVKKDQSSSATAAAIRTFLSYVISTSGGSSSSYLTKDQFEALPSSVVPQVQAAIASVQ